jgi:transposase
MMKSLSPSERGFNAHDWQRLSQALTQAVEAHLFRRIQAVPLVAEGRTFVETAHITGLSHQAVYNLIHRYLQPHQIESLHDRPHPGRTPDTADLQASQILRELRRSPLKLGYRTNV